MLLFTDYKFLRNVEVLCIDDLGTDPRENMNYGDIITAVTDIIMYRCQEQFCTISTSNLSANEISGYYDERFEDRLRELKLRDDGCLLSIERKQEDVLISRRVIMIN